MLGYLLIGMGAVLLASLVIVIGRMTIRAVLDRIKQKNAEKLALRRAKELMSDVINARNQETEQKEAISIGELEALLGAEGCVEYTLNSEGKVNADDISILQADTMEPKLQALFDQNGGDLLLTA